MPQSKAYVLHYQDETGAVHTARIISDNVELDSRLHECRLDVVFKSWGWDLISVQRVDALHHEIPAPADGWRARWMTAGYRLAIILVLVTNLVDIAWTWEQEHRIDHEILPLARAWLHENPEARRFVPDSDALTGP